MVKHIIMEDLALRRLLALVNSALWNKPIDECLFADMDDKKWNSLYHFAIRQGVMAVAFDGAEHLPKAFQPPLKLHIAWALSTERIEQKYQYMKDVATELTTMFGKEGIDMLVFKGLSLSGYYPVPARREFGDIDIYLFEQHEKGDRVMADGGARKKGRGNFYKHSNYYYKDVMIENHAYLLSVRDSKEIAYLNKRLLDILERDKKDTAKSQDGLLYPSPDFTALFFILHAIRHLTAESVPLRTFCDWALFLQAHAGEIDLSQWKKTLQEVGLLDIAEALTALAFRWLEVPAAARFPIGNHPQWENSIVEEMLQPPHSSGRSKTRWGILLYKYRSLNKRCRRYIAIYGGNPVAYYISRISRSVIFHIRYPETILRLK